MSRGAFAFACLLFVLPVMAQTTKPVLVGGDVIVSIDAEKHSGTTTIQLRNTSADSLPVGLYAGKFILKSTKLTMTTPVTFSPDGGKSVAYLQHKLPPNSSFFTQLTVSDFDQAGEAHAYLFNNQDTLAAIRAVMFNVPFAVGLNAAANTVPELLLRQGKTSFFELKNDDPFSYPVRWELLLDDGIVLAESTIVVPGKSTISVPLQPAQEAFPSVWSGLFKDQVRDGRLLLRFAPPGEVAQPGPRMKTLPVKLRMQSVSSGWQAFGSNFLIIALLVLGGATSLFLNLWIPNKQQRIDLLHRIDALARKTRAISNNIDSALRVGVRVERMRLAQLIRAMWLLSGDAVTLLTAYKSEINLLEKRLDLMQELDDVLEALEALRAKSADAPATILDEVGKNLGNASVILKLPTPEEKDFQRALEIVHDSGQKLRNIMEVNPQLAEQLADSVKKLSESFDQTTGIMGKTQKCKELRPKLKELFSLFQTTVYLDKANIQPIHYHWLSSTIERLYVLRHYVRAWENADTKGRALIKRHEEEMLNYLGIRTWNALHSARCLRSEVEESIYTEDIVAQLTAGAISIDVIPLQPQPNQPIRLTARLNRNDLNTCTARQKFTCIWDFGPIGKEEGWEISHYFIAPDDSHEKEQRTLPQKLKAWFTSGSRTPRIEVPTGVGFSVSFRQPDGTFILMPNDTKPVVVSQWLQLQEAGKKQSSEQWTIEWIKLGVALGAAILGLIAGAREQLLKLDTFSALVAIFLLGFGADTIKNIITRQPKNEG